MENFNLLNENKIKANLKRSLIENTVLKIFKSVDSTNNQAKNFIKSFDEKKNKINSEKIIIFAADRQFAGRGRKGHNWFSNDSASLAVSFLFKAENDLSQIPQITAAAGLAVEKSLKKFQLEGHLKWPNDILVKNKKISGILSELIFNKKKDAYIIIGCGINLNNSSFESKIEEIATSYYLEKKEKIDKNLFLAELIQNMYYYIKEYFGGSRKAIIEKWKKKLNLKGKKIDLVYKDTEYTVTIKNIIDSGELLAIFDNGKEKKLQSLNTSLDYQSLVKYNND